MGWNLSKQLTSKTNSLIIYFFEEFIPTIAGHGLLKDE
jgi:hypothetical protein